MAFSIHDLTEMLKIDVPVAALILRGTLMYLGVFALLKIVPRRENGTLGTPDLLLVVFIADAAQNGMTAEYKSVTSGLILISTLFFWDFFLDYLAFNVPSLSPLINGTPLLLISHGVPNRRNMRKEMISSDDLTSLLREQGIEDIHEVARAYIEPSGSLGIIKAKGKKIESKPSSKK